MIAFRYRARHSPAQPTIALVGGAAHLEEQTEYILSFASPPSAAVQRRIATLGGEMLQPDVAALGFGNFVGSAELAGVRLEVLSKKIGTDGVSRLLQDVSEIGSNLIFGWQGKTQVVAREDTSHLAPIPFHQFLLIRDVALRRRSGERFQDWVAEVDRAATRRFEPDRPSTRVDRVRRIDHRSMASIFSHLDRLVPVPEPPMASHPLAQALTFGVPPSPHFPVSVPAPKSRLSYDTPENRFVKHVIGEALAIVQRFAGRPQLAPELEFESREILEILLQLSHLPMFQDVGRLAGFNAPSQVLLKADGYRELFDFWNRLTRHLSLPLHSEDVSRLLDGRDLATLYEYWVLAKVVEALATVLQCSPARPPRILRDEFGESLSLGFNLPVGPEISVSYNRTYSRSATTAYSTPLRPDVTVEGHGFLFAFDAKFKLSRIDTDDGDPDEDNATYKRADIYKMHTYRDAISGLRAAFVVYPGSEFVFFERGGKRCGTVDQVTSWDGVGAIPLRPTGEAPAAALGHVLGTLFAANA